MSLAQRSLRSSTYTISASVITTIVQLVRSILLARLIAPDVFGLYTYAASFVLITRAFPIFGMDSALLHRAPESEGDIALRVHFSLSIIFNIFWAILISISGFIFMAPEKRWVLLAILATQFADNLTLTTRALLMRRVVFRRIALVQITTALLSTLSSLLLAWNGYGALSLVSADIAAALVAVLGFLVILPPWKPRLAWSPQVARYLLNFGQRNFLANLVGQALDNIDNLWAGHFLGDAKLGYYSRAYTFSSYPRRVLSGPLSSVASSTYAVLKEDPKRLSQAFFRVNALLVRSGFMMAGLLTLIAPEFIRLVIGVKWLPMLDAFRLMLLFTMLDPIRFSIGGLFISVGAPEKNLWARLVQLAVLVPCLFIFGQKWEISGIAIAVNLMMAVGIIIQLWQARAYVNYSLVRLFAVPTLALAAGIGTTYLALQMSGIVNSPWLTGLIKIVIFSLIYAAIILLLERREIPTILEYIKIILPGKKNIPHPTEDQTN